MPDPGSEERIRELEERMAAMPGSRIFATLADEYRRAGLHEAALHILQTGLVHHPTYLSAHIALARLYQEMGRTEDAVQAYEKVLATDRENLVAAKGLAEIHEQRGELLDAVKRWKLYRALSGDRDVDEKIQSLESRVRPPAPPQPDAPSSSLAPAPEPDFPAMTSFDFAPLEPAAETAPEPPAATVPEAAAAPVDHEFETLLHAPSLNQVFSSSEDVFPMEEPAGADRAEEPAAREDFSPPPMPEEASARESVPEFIDVERTEPMRMSDYVSEPREESIGRDAEPTADVPVAPPEIPPSRTLADLYLEQGYHDDARKMYERLAAANPLDESVNLRLHRLRHGEDAAAPVPEVSTVDRVRAAKIAALAAWLDRVRAAGERGRGTHV